MAQSLSNLPIGAKIKFGKYSVNGESAQDIIWLIAAKNHSGYPSNATTLITEKIIDVRPYDAPEEILLPDEITGYGNNKYSVSNIDQWLNKSTTPWYTNAHIYDSPPNVNSNITDGSDYETRPGFLNAFTEKERNSILSTPLRVTEYTAGNISINRKVFLPSWTELGGTDTKGEGVAWSYFTTKTRGATITNQLAYNTRVSNPGAIGEMGSYWIRTSESSGPTHAYYVYGTQSQGRQLTNFALGVRPALNISSNELVSDGTDSDGCYTVIPNTAPHTPSNVNVSAYFGGKSTTISWSGVSDPDGNSVTYQLEQSINGGEYTTLYNGTNLAYNTIIPYGVTDIVYRVKAIDSFGASSEYRYSDSVWVVNNTAPVISGADSNLGVQFIEFTQTYSVEDVDNDIVTVTEAIDGVKVRSYTTTLGANNTFSVAGNTWLALPNGIHTMTITATDGIDTSVRTYVFTKVVTSFTVQKATPMESSVRPIRIKVNIVKNLPPEATFKVEVCNNGFDSSPIWEDATSVVLAEQRYEFNNKEKNAAKWGVNIRVTVNRNNGSGACYITSIGGNWE